MVHEWKGSAIRVLEGLFSKLGEHGLDLTSTLAPLAK
jgi:hypothetical protein